MKILPDSLDYITEQFARFSGIGKKTAQRMAFQLLEWGEEDVKRFGETIVTATQKIGFCSQCHLISESDPCPVCNDPRRETSMLCVVEDAKDVVAIEKTARFKGRYHVLGGVLSPLDGIGPDQLNVQTLIPRLEGVTEVILAMNPSVEGETTALYLAKILKERGIQVTRLARGIPVGGDLEYIDELTLGRALDERHDLS